MSKPGILLLGAGGHAYACIDVIEQQGQFQISGLVGLPEQLGQEHLGYRVIGSDDGLEQLAQKHNYAFIVLGQIKSPDPRMHLFARLRELGFKLPVITSPAAYVSRHATVGAGTIVMPGAIINAGAKVGTNCIINSRALVEHGGIVGDHCHIATGAILNGGVRIGDGSFIGSGVTIKEGVSIGPRCIVGMGLCVRHNQADHTRVTSNV